MYNHWNHFRDKNEELSVDFFTINVRLNRKKMKSFTEVSNNSISREKSPEIFQMSPSSFRRHLNNVYIIDIFTVLNIIIIISQLLCYIIKNFKINLNIYPKTNNLTCIINYTALYSWCMLTIVSYVSSFISQKQFWRNIWDFLS